MTFAQWRILAGVEHRKREGAGVSAGRGFPLPLRIESGERAHAPPREIFLNENWVFWCVLEHYLRVRPNRLIRNQ